MGEPGSAREKEEAILAGEKNGGALGRNNAPGPPRTRRAGCEERALDMTLELARTTVPILESPTRVRLLNVHRFQIGKQAWMRKHLNAGEKESL